ncbi:OB-fold protein [Leptospira haakeii]|nr:hypothetical protein [Leptospira haakeii]
MPFLKDFFLNVNQSKKDTETPGKSIEAKEQKIADFLIKNGEFYAQRFCAMKIIGERNEGSILGVVIRENPSNPYLKVIWKFKKIEKKLVLIEFDETTLEYPQYDFAELKSEFDSNALRASSELQGKIIGVNGNVWKVETDLLGHPYVAFSGSEETGDVLDFEFLKCFLLPEALSIAKTLEKGQRINITGKLVGKEFVKIELRECTISEYFTNEDKIYD